MAAVVCLKIQIVELERWLLSVLLIQVCTICTNTYRDVSLPYILPDILQLTLQETVNSLTLKVLVVTIDAQWEGMGM